MLSPASDQTAAGSLAAAGPDARLFTMLTGREPAPGELDALPADPAALATALGSSVEVRNRFRDAARDDDEVRTAVRLWPASSRPYDLHILVVSGDPWSKSARTIEALAPRLGGRIHLTLVTRHHDPKPFPVADGLDLVVIEDRSIFQLRALLPTLFREAAWISVLEDHSVPTPEWLDGLLATIGDQPPGTLAITGTAMNLDTTSPWSWANFMFNLYRHWHPSDAETLTGTVATTVFRRDIAGTRPWRIHEYEHAVLGRTMPLTNAFPVNHVQQTTFREASLHVIDNGLVYGSSLRRNADNPRQVVVASIRWVLFGRMREIADVLARHPRAAELPPGTVRRIRWIAWCHSLGVVLGALFGGGRAHMRLE